MPTSSAVNSDRRSSTTPAALALAWLMLSMTACASPPTPVRLMIEFRTPTEGAAPELLSRLERQSGVTMRFSSSVSTRRHSYELRCPPRDARCDTAIRKLREDPAVMDIVPDTLRTAHPSPP